MVLKKGVRSPAAFSFSQMIRPCFKIIIKINVIKAMKGKVQDALEE